MNRPDARSIASVLTWSQALNVNRRDAAALLAHAADRPRSWVYAFPEKDLTPEAFTRACNLIERRAGQEPLAYLLGFRDFWSLELEVSPAVLIPRIETETLVQAVLDRTTGMPSPRIADLGTGSGAIILALGRERPDAVLMATDLSKEALKIAALNAQRHDIRVDLRQGSWLQPLAGETLDVIVSNPPYIVANDPHLNQGDLRFEPRSALVAADDGMADYRALIPGARKYLKRGGLLALEHGATQRAAVIRVLEETGYTDIEALDDDFGKARVVCARN